MIQPGAKTAGVPEAITFQTKPEIALDQIRAAADAGLPRGVVLMDAGYGSDTQLRTDVTALGLSYIAGILSNTSVWAQGRAPLAAQALVGPGTTTKLMRGDSEHQPISVKALALALGPEAWTEIAWREGAADRLTSRFARVRVRAAHRDYWLGEPRPEEWLLIEWPEGEKEPTKYWFSTLPEDISFVRLVELAKLRWRIERDYQELKQELGLGHYEGRSWRGFHHHATLCIAAYGFLVAERGAISPSGSAAPKLKAIGLPARLSTPRRLRSDRSGTCRTQSPPCAGGSPWPWPKASSDVRAAQPTSADLRTIPARDAVVLEATAPQELRYDLRNPISFYVDQPVKPRHRFGAKMGHWPWPAMASAPRPAETRPAAPRRRVARRPLRLSLTQRVRNSAARLRTRRDEPVSCGNSNKRPSCRRADHAPRRTCSLSASYCRANFCHRAACYSPTRPRDLCPNKAPQLWRSWRARLARTRWPVCRTQEPEPGLWRAARNALQSRGGDWVRHRGRNR